jgi:hypothetical protein
MSHIQYIKHLRVKHPTLHLRDAKLLADAHAYGVGSNYGIGGNNINPVSQAEYAKFQSDLEVVTQLAAKIQATCFALDLTTAENIAKALIEAGWRAPEPEITYDYNGDSLITVTKWEDAVTGFKSFFSDVLCFEGDNDDNEVPEDIADDEPF